MNDLNEELRENRRERRREDGRLNESLTLMRAVRWLCLFMLVVLMVGGIGLGFIFDYMQGTRAEIKKTQAQSAEILTNHARTQRLICGWYRANDIEPPTGDCEGR